MCGRHAELEARFASPAGAPFVARLVEAARRVLTLALASSMSAPETAALCREQGADGATADAVAAVWMSRQEDLVEAARRKASTLASGTLEDFDWSLRVVLSSSTSARMRDPLLVLTFFVREEVSSSDAAAGGSSAAGDASDGTELVEHVVELTKGDLDGLVRDLDSIDAVLAKYVPAVAPASSTASIAMSAMPLSP